MVYVLCDKYIHGTMNAVLLLHKKLVKSFKNWGLTMNLHDPCVWNKVDEGSQLIIFHIDDLILAHSKPMITTKYIKLLDGIYGSKDPLTVTRGRIHEYLGMTIDFSMKVGVAITQYDFVKKMYKELHEDLKGAYRNTPATDFLFKVDNSAEPLSKTKKEEYHKTTAKFIWISQCSRPDSQLSTELHSTRVKNPTVCD